MSINIPPYDELSEEQRDILLGMEEGQNSLVTGPPGTGKTVMAMLRAQALVQESPGTKASLIMYNKVLVAYSGSWQDPEFKNGVDVRTYHSWVYKIWSDLIARDKPPHMPNDKWSYDWGQIIPEFTKRRAALGHVIVDEAQDQPKEFYQFLGAVSAVDPDTDCCVVADENQQLHEGNASINDIKKGLSVAGVPQDFPLTRNYRNTRPIAELAKEFYTGTKTGIPELPSGRNSKGRRPLLVNCPDQQRMIDRIWNYARNNQEHSILVICTAGEDVKKFFNELQKKQKTASSSHRVQAYVNRKYLHCKSCNGTGKDGTRKCDCQKSTHQKSQLQTGDPGVITIVHHKSMKGLEGDAVFVPHLEKQNRGNDSSDTEKMILYVMLSRARSYLEVQHLPELGEVLDRDFGNPIEGQVESLSDTWISDLRMVFKSLLPNLSQRIIDSIFEEYVEQNQERLIDLFKEIYDSRTRDSIEELIDEIKSALIDMQIVVSHTGVNLINEIDVMANSLSEVGKLFKENIEEIGQAFQLDSESGDRPGSHGNIQGNRIRMEGLIGHLLKPEVISLFERLKA